MYVKNWIKAIFAYIAVRLGYKFNKSKIPKGTHYCYLPDTYKNNKECNILHYYIIPCPYYVWLGKYRRSCLYLGYIGDDFCFNDQCKICGENYED